MGGYERVSNDYDDGVKDAILHNLHHLKNFFDLDLSY